MDGVGSVLDAANVTKLADGNVYVSNGGRLSFPALPGATNVNLTASTGGRIALPTMTAYTSQSLGNTIQANGPASRIELPALTTFTGATADGCLTYIKAQNGGTVVLAGQFSGRNRWTVDGLESLIDLTDVTQFNGTSFIAANGATWVLPAGWTPQIGAGNSLATSGTGSSFVNQANLTVSGVALAINTSAFVNRGTLNAQAGGVFDFNGSFRVDDPGLLASVTSGRFTVSGDLLGDTRNAGPFAPTGEVRLDGVGTAANPQRWEALSRDLGPYETGFARNFAFGKVALTGRTYVQLVDRSRNAAGGQGEAVYVDTLVVPAGTTLDLNGLHLYARTMQIAGTVLNGKVEQVLPNQIPTVEAEARATPVSQNPASGMDGHWRPQVKDIIRPT